MLSQSFAIVSKSTVFPDEKSALADLKLSVSDLPTLCCHYIQEGVLFTKPPFPILELISLLKQSLSQTLTRFPPLAGRLTTDADGYVYVTCNDAGADFIHANGSHIRVRDLLNSDNGDVPELVKGCFALDGTVNYEGHFGAISAVQVTELADGIFIGCTINHAVTDGTSFWDFFNSFAELSRGVKRISRTPDFSRDSILNSPVVPKLPAGGPKVTFSGDAPVRERIFRFTRESILKLKDKVNKNDDGGIDVVAELMGRHSNDTLKSPDRNLTPLTWQRNSVSRETSRANPTVEISSFQSLCALLWRGITRARKLPSSKTTTFRMAVNCRHRLEPKLDPLYFGNAIQTVRTYALAGDVLSKDLRWCAQQLNKSVVAHNNAAVRKYVENWKRDPKCFLLSNFDGTMITMGGSSRSPVYDTDFGWGRPIAVRSGRANKFDGKISAFPGREGGGSVDLEVILAAETMAGLESDLEFMQYVSSL
ncbi:Shikimate O-hydroxycinnamoyltransferase [Handroanthus impetiginosus]|uniref:Shikimate O-hydroxycinnamoyltransferase n=1 Tax=Handroanthus impetiginosus TaxID=429701 RepID=A0A2G9HLH6_9LAMI|nr:Shikimate O-hydroxycinnamoyltransferase [Handroanthus impetiginosus]